MRLARQLDLAVLVLALPVFLVADLPVGGWALGAGVWMVQRGIAFVFDRRASRSDDPRSVVGYAAGGAILRGWLAALTVLVVGILTGEDVGLSAVVLILILFTVYFGVKVTDRLASEAGPERR